MTVGVGPQAGVGELVGDLEGLVQIGLRSCEVSGRRLQPAGDEQTSRSGLPRERVRCGERTAEAFGTGDTVAEDDPRPSEARSRCGHRAAGRGPRPRRGRRRCSPAPPGRSRPPRPGRGRGRWPRSGPPGSRTTWRAPPLRCRAGPTRAGGRVHTRGCCRGAGSEPTHPVTPRGTRGSGRPGARRRRPLTSRGRRDGQGPPRWPRGALRRRSTTVPTGPAGRRGTAGRSSTRSPRRGLDAARAAGSSDLAGG